MSKENRQKERNLPEKKPVREERHIMETCRNQPEGSRLQRRLRSEISVKIPVCVIASFANQGFVMEYQRACIEALRRHFVGNVRNQNEISQLEIQSLERIKELTEEENRIDVELKDAKERLQKIRAERFNTQPSLFD